MAKHVGLPMRGTVGDLSYYIWKGEYYVRKKREKIKKKVLETDPRYWKTQRNYSCFGHASNLMQDLYWNFPQERKEHGVFGKLCGAANKLIRMGKTDEEVKAAIREQFGF